ncbi:MAG: nickel-dependent hydrogenase large subunit [Promethearchaeota archaeon]
MTGKTLTIPLGPQHPALKEPENFTLTLDGEIVTDVAIRIGYVHRGIEKAFEGRSYIQNVYLAERICGICSQAHTTCYVQVVEELLDLDVPKRGLHIRAIVNELNRIHSHILWLGVAGHEIGWDTLFHYSWRDREQCMDVIEEVTGNRVNYANNVIGGVRHDIPKDWHASIAKRMQAIQDRMEHYLKLILKEQTVLDRCLGVGILKPHIAKKLSATGPTIRASGIPWDVRETEPRTPYIGAPWKVQTSDLCDVAGRVIVRIQETIDSCQSIRHWLTKMPRGDIKVRAPRRVPEGQAISRFEAPRGEVVHFIVSDGTDHPYRHKARAPTLGNFLSVPTILIGGHIADVPISLASIDPCMSCTDRVILTDHRGRSEAISWEKFTAQARETRLAEKAWRR